jgi:type III restriction enzyme
MNKIIQHIWSEIRAVNTEKLMPVFDKEKPIRSTGEVRTLHTSKPCEWTENLISAIVFMTADGKRQRE